MIGPCLTTAILDINIQRNKFDGLQEIPETPTVNDEYENFVNAHLEATAECVPTKQRAKPRVPWETFTIRTKMCRRENRLPTQ